MLINNSTEWSATNVANLNQTQKVLFKYLHENAGKSITAEALEILFKLGLRKIKLNLTLLKKKDIGIEEEFCCIKYPNGGLSLYSNGFYFKKY